MNAALSAFDRIAPGYDDDWTRSPAGRLQREAVRRELGVVFLSGDRVLDIGCGTGEDAVWLAQRGVQMRAIDPSPEMVRLARAKGIEASVGEIGDAAGVFDGVLSNFAAMNCIENPATLRTPLAHLVKRGGHLALCVFGKFCVWETAWHLLHLDARRATRRWRGKSHSASIGIDVYYPSVARIARALAPEFVLLRTAGVGLLVPPSYVTGLPEAVVEAAGALDKACAHLPGFRSLCDHRLLIFRRR
jgi:SAM-dependent methyltransferase